MSITLIGVKFGLQLVQEKKLNLSSFDSGRWSLFIDSSIALEILSGLIHRIQTKIRKGTSTTLHIILMGIYCIFKWQWTNVLKNIKPVIKLVNAGVDWNLVYLWHFGEAMTSAWLYNILNTIQIKRKNTDNEVVTQDKYNNAKNS